MTAVDILDDNTYLGAESSYNLFTVQRNADRRYRRQTWNARSFAAPSTWEIPVNRFRRGSLVMRMPDQSDDTTSSPPPLKYPLGYLAQSLVV